ncbi:ASCH domain protein [Enterococcus faecalis 13-SD-W-01]|nr:ASCH domain protein [Enterococcus faecalis 13-SD-W-01]
MSIERFWQECCQQTGIEENYSDTWAFGNTPKQADELLELVLAGKKTATSSAKELYERDNDPFPAAGEYSILLDGKEEPKAVILTTKIEEYPFDEVPAAFAYREGEGDRSLAYWREVHEQFFKEEYQKAGLTFHEKIPCLCETFELIYYKE